MGMTKKKKINYEKSNNTFIDTDHNMNLRVLKRNDEYAIDIEEKASHVAVYSFDELSQSWIKLEIEGPLFLYRRSKSPFYGCVVMNRLALEHFVTLITSHQTLSKIDNYLMYRDEEHGNTMGIWFYKQEERDSIAEAWQRFEYPALTSDHTDDTNHLTMLLQRAMSTTDNEHCDINDPLDIEVTISNIIKELPSKGMMSRIEFCHSLVDAISANELLLDKLYGMYLSSMFRKQ